MWQEKHCPSELTVILIRSCCFVWSPGSSNDSARTDPRGEQLNSFSVTCTHHDSARCHLCTWQVPQVRTVEVIKEVQHWSPRKKCAQEWRIAKQKNIWNHLKSKILISKHLAFAWGSQARSTTSGEAGTYVLLYNTVPFCVSFAFSTDLWNCVNCLIWLLL